MGRYGHSEERPILKPLFAMTTQVSIKVHLLIQVYHNRAYLSTYFGFCQLHPTVWLTILEKCLKRSTLMEYYYYHK